MERKDKYLFIALTITALIIVAGFYIGNDMLFGAEASAKKFTVTMTPTNATTYKIVIAKSEKVVLRDVNIYVSVGNDMMLSKHYDYWTSTQNNYTTTAMVLEGQMPQVKIDWQGGTSTFTGN